MSLGNAIHVELVDGPVLSSPSEAVAGCGAVVCFEGIVRPEEDEEPLHGLKYTSYDPMAERELQRVAEHAFERHVIRQIMLVHSRGLVLAGQVSLRLIVASAHRKPAIAAVDEIIDGLKRDVPIWKSPVFDGQTR